MLITIVTVSFNCQNTIGETINSVRSQKYKKVQHLIIDGNSNDHTMRVVKENNYPQLDFKSEPDYGIYDAMNKGLNLAKGEIIGFLNADDFYADDQCLTRVANAFKQTKSAEACFGDLIYLSSDGKTVKRIWKSKPFKKGSFSLAWSPAHPTFYIRRSALERLGGFDLEFKFAGDAEFMMRYLEIGNVESIYIPFVQVKMRLGGLTNQNFANIISQNIEILRALRKNKQKYSMCFFILFKIFHRIKQRLLGLKIMVTK